MNEETLKELLEEQCARQARADGWLLHFPTANQWERAVCPTCRKTTPTFKKGKA
jgi:hypothetical protein